MLKNKADMIGRYIFLELYFAMSSAGDLYIREFVTSYSSTSTHII